MASKSMNERVSFPLNRKLVATGRNKRFVLKYLQEMEKIASNGRDISEIGTKWFLLARNLVSNSQYEGFIEK